MGLCWQEERKTAVCPGQKRGQGKTGGGKRGRRVGDEEEGQDDEQKMRVEGEKRVRKRKGGRGSREWKKGNRRKEGEK